MFQNIREISLLNRIFNVRGNEWPKIMLAWLISFLYMAGFVIGWTIIVAMFVSRYGISSLPYLFIANAVFIILGSLLYSTFIDRLKKGSIMIVSLFVAVVVLFGAFYFSDKNPILFFGLLIVAEAIFLGQFRIILNGFIEDMFTPIQSERTFPLIESSITIGGIIGGLTITLLANSINVPSFVLIWIVFLLLIVPTLLFYGSMNKHKKEKEAKPIGLITKLKKGLSNKKHLSYIKGIFLIVLFQWLLFNLLEFQYTKAVYQNVSHVILNAGSGFEHALAHDLGQLFILFSTSALIIQLFVASRLINSLGIVGSMMLHPIVTLLSFFGLTISYNFTTAVLAKNNFTITTAIYINAYYSSYYAVKDKLREYVREFLDGIVRPVGAVLGTLVIIGLQRLFVGESLTFHVNIAMLIAALILLYVTYLQQSKYTNVALDDLTHSENEEVRFNAIDILAQKGHKSSLPVLKKILLDKKESPAVRVRILQAFSELQENSVIRDIIKSFKDKESEIRSAALDALLAYKILKKESKRYLVIEYELIDELEKLYKKEKDRENRSKILTLLSQISTVATFEFLVNVLKNSRGKLKADAIYALGNYSDCAVVNFVRPYLKSRDCDQQIAAIITIGRFDSFKDEAWGMIAKLLHCGSNNRIADAIYAIGELNLKRKRKICMRYLHSKNNKLRMNSAIALAKMANVDVRFCQNLDKLEKRFLNS